MKKIFMTGGTGFIGDCVLKQLIEKKYEIYVLTRKERVGFGQTHFIQGNISDVCSLKHKIEQIKPDILLHLAWDVKSGDYANNPENIQWIKWSAQLADCFLAAGGKAIIAAGTCFEYDLSLGKPLNEQSLCKPQTLYGRCKAEVQQSLNQKCKSAGARFAWGRIFYPYGIEEEKRKLFSSVIATLKQEKTFICGSENIIDYIHQTDVAGMFVEVVQHDHLSGVFNIGSGTGYKVGDLVTMIAKKMGKEHLISFKNGPIKQIIVSDNAKIISSPYKLRYTMEQGLNEMIGRND